MTAPVTAHDTLDEMAEEADPQLHTLAALAADPTLLQPPQAMAPLTYRGRITLLAGREKSGKSTVASAIAAMVSHRHTVIWLALDEALPELVQRLVRMGANPERVFITTTVNDSTLPAIRAHDPGLVVVDHVGRLAERDPDFRAGTGGDAILWGRLLAPWVALSHAEDGPAVHMLSQASKARDEYLNSVAIGAAVDVISTVRRDERTEVRTVDSLGRFPVAALRLDLLDNGTLTFVGGDSPGLGRRATVVDDRPVTTDQQKQILAACATGAPEGFTAAEWKRVSTESYGWSRSVYYRIRKVVYEAGYVCYTSRKWSVSGAGQRLLRADTTTTEPLPTGSDADAEREPE